jgi:hypothetical protein
MVDAKPWLVTGENNRACRLKTRHERYATTYRGRYALVGFVIGRDNDQAV